MDYQSLTFVQITQWKPPLLFSHWDTILREENRTGWKQKACQCLSSSIQQVQSFPYCNYCTFAFSYEAPPLWLWGSRHHLFYIVSIKCQFLQDKNTQDAHSPAWSAWRLFLTSLKSSIDCWDVCKIPHESNCVSILRASMENCIISMRLHQGYNFRISVNEKNPIWENQSSLTRRELFSAVW